MTPKRKVTDLLPSEAIRVSPSQDGRVFDIEPIPTEAEKVEVDELSKIARYDLGYCSGDDGICTAEMKECSDGDYVLWSDIEYILKTRNPETK